ncbi:hypothetical protein C2G38_2136427 [Gigaspora rosea]|uniref:Ion transport domain-containing protein n=1 Tax=Gigaspora rosea TaxID=44941 RepID=A0A397W9D7_9GLOM|nr:hypothetical protein C2G38_2136427 [Gigaspora rosea]
MSKDEETIEMEDDETEDESPKPHKGEEITKLLLSPNGKYAVTWSEDEISICGWQLDQLVEQSVNQSEKQSVEQLKDELHQSKHFEFDCAIFYLGEDPEISAVSNNKLVAMQSLMADGYYEATDKSFGTIEVIDLSKEKKEAIRLELESNGYAHIDCRFDNNGDLLIVTYDSYGFNVYKISFQNLHNDKQIWKINNSIHCGTVMRCYIMVCQITKEEKIILIDECGSLTQWNLNLLFEKQYQLNAIDANASICIFNRDVTLLVVYCYRIIYVYLTENSLLLSRSKVNFELHHLEFVSPGKEERLLLFNDSDTFKLEDPYHLPDVIELGIVKSITEICGSLELLNKETLKQVEFKTVKDGKIYYILEGRLWVQEISGELWAKYLRKEFKDYNENRTLPSKFQVENVLQMVIGETEERKSQFVCDDGSLVKWEVNDIQIQAFWKVDSKSIDSIRLINGLYYSTTIYSCKVLNNEDLIMITNVGIFIWSIWQNCEKKIIRLRYYITLNYESMNLNKSDFEQLLNNIQEYKGKDSLPTPNFDFIIRNVESISTESDESDKRYLFKELLDDYIEDKILMKLYGQELLTCCLKLKKYSMVGRLCSNIYKKMENDNFLLKIQHLDIFTGSFVELTRFPQFLKEFLLHTSFIHSADSFEEIKFNKFFSDPHLQNHITYLQPYFKSNVRKNIKQFFTLLKQSLPFFNTIKEEKIYKDSQVIVLIFPLPKFSSYNSTYNPWKELIFPEPSVFSKHQFPELYKYWQGEALLNFKWNTYGKYYYFVIFIFYFIFMVCFLIVATIKGLSNYTQNLLLFTTIILGILHLIFEIRQFIYFPLSWISDIWNYFDIGAILFPTLTSIDWLQSSTTPIWAITISILLLELKFITFFRAIEFGGTHWVMIIGVIQHSLSFFVIIGFIMFAFAHSLHILLRQTTDTSNDLNNSEESDTNMFTNLDTAYLAVYMMLTGDSSYLSNWSLTENLTLTILIILFSFFTTIYLMNLFIGLLSNFISETNKKDLFLLQRAKILSEIELFYMLPYQRRKNNWFPEIMFSLDKFYEVVYKIQNNNWDEAFEIPFIPDTLLKIVNLYEDNEEDILFQKLESIKKEMQKLTDDQRKKIIQKLETSQEITKFIEKVD